MGQGQDQPMDIWRKLAVAPSIYRRGFKTLTLLGCLHVLLGPSPGALLLSIALLSAVVTKLWGLTFLAVCVMPLLPIAALLVGLGWVVTFGALLIAAEAAYQCRALTVEQAWHAATSVQWYALGAAVAVGLATVLSSAVVPGLLFAVVIPPLLKAAGVSVPGWLPYAAIGLVLPFAAAPGTFAVPAVFLEGVNVRTALRRSLALTQGSWLRLGAPLAAVALLLLGAGAVGISAATLLAPFVGGIDSPMVVLPLLVVGVLVGPLLAAFTLVLYYDQRVRLRL